MQLVCFGAGSTGRVIVRNHREHVCCLVDNNFDKWGQIMEGVEVLAPEIALDRYPDATWIASVITPSIHKEISDEIAQLGVKTADVLDFLPKRHGLPPDDCCLTLSIITADSQTDIEVLDQIEFRKNPATYQQRPASDIGEIYFPSFIIHREDEHFVDCGAADGDTAKAFIERWDKWRMITVYEPDPENWRKCYELFDKVAMVYGRFAAVTDISGIQSFVNTGDYSAHLGDGPAKTTCVRLDDEHLDHPTFIKMDIEGSELQALWGARRILKEHKPVLAICAYHEASHLWEIPLLIHAIQPEYSLFLRRYARGTFELVWYAVPPDRVL